MLGRSVAGSMGRERRGEVREAGGPCGMGTDAGSFRRRLDGKGAPPETEKKLRREIANSNERRRMQNINWGFQSLKTLLPRQDGEKLSKVLPSARNDAPCLGSRHRHLK